MIGVGKIIKPSDFDKYINDLIHLYLTYDIDCLDKYCNDLDNIDNIVEMITSPVRGRWLSLIHSNKFTNYYFSELDSDSKSYHTCGIDIICYCAVNYSITRDEINHNDIFLEESYNLRILYDRSFDIRLIFNLDAYRVISSISTYNSNDTGVMWGWLINKFKRK